MSVADHELIIDCERFVTDFIEFFLKAGSEVRGGWVGVLILETLHLIDS